MLLNRSRLRFDWGTVCFWLAASATVFLLLRTAWCTEDSYISFRVVKNFLSGFGLTWNPGERVQVYTDPLFLFLLIFATWLSGSAYWSAIAISLMLTMGAFFLIMKGRSSPAILLGTSILLSSKAFMDFSVSGMENPATHLGIAMFCWTYWRRREPLILTLIASVTAVNRLDSLLLFLPPLLFTYYQTGWKSWRAVLLGFAPLVGWELFSFFYYGFAFPNTAYAKLGAGIASQELINQGFLYLKNSMQWDRVTAATIVIGFVYALWLGEWAFALGLWLSIAYVVRVGGDFMSGRFLSAPLVLSCAIIVWHVRLHLRTTALLFAATLLICLSNPRPTLTTTKNFGISDAKISMIDGIADERVFFYRATGLMRWKRDQRWPDFEWSDYGDRIRNSGQRVVALKPVGLIPYRAGPRVHVIDEGALADPLLARLRAVETDRRPGHYFRLLPKGYFETVESGTNQIQDAHLAEFYNHLHEIVSGELLSRRRFREIIAMNLGRYDSLLPK